MHSDSVLMGRWVRADDIEVADRPLDPFLPPVTGSLQVNNSRSVQHFPPQGLHPAKRRRRPPDGEQTLIVLRDAGTRTRKDGGREAR